MRYQFIHIEAVSKSGRDLYYHNNGKKTVTGHISIDSVLGEAGRLDGYISHIENPQPPVILYGDKDRGIEDVRQKTDEWNEGSKDARGHKIRKDANILLAGVASYPPKEDNEDEKDYDAKRNAFEADLIKWLKKVYGEDLALVLRHDDEPFKGRNEGKIHYHWHYYCVKKPGKKFDLHPGFKARAEKDISRQDKKNITSDQIKEALKEGKLAYRNVMSAFQERFYQELSKFHGFKRYGPIRLRRTRSEQKEFEKIRDQVIKTAKKEAEKEALKITEQANNEADKIRNQAKFNAQSTIQTAETQAAVIRKKADEDAKKTKDDAWKSAKIIKEAAEKQAEAILTNAKGFINVFLEQAAKLPRGETLIKWAKTFIKKVAGSNQTIIQDTNYIKPTRKHKNDGIQRLR